MKKFTKRQKIRIYKLALKNYLYKIEHINGVCGMCMEIYRAGVELYPDRRDVAHSVYSYKEFWKEFYQYEPKRKHHTGYWWVTRNTKRRIRILSTLSKGQFDKTPKTFKNA